MRNIVILISGGGSNMRAIVEASRRNRWAARLNARVKAVVSNRADAGGLSWAREQGIDTEVVDHLAYKQANRSPQANREAFDAALLEAVMRHDPALVALAGFMRILTPVFVAPLQDRMLNIHPSLLPAFAGLHTHARAIAAGCKFAGATVHRVIPELDAGPILDQAVVPVLPGDTEHTLSARVLTQEHRIYPAAIARLLAA
jgi:phosphoribosylglycinamide formyltransferase 1